MKRFLVFTGCHYYPSGGWDDYDKNFDTIEEAMDYLTNTIPDSFDWWQIVDLQTGVKVKEDLEKNLRKKD